MTSMFRTVFIALIAVFAVSAVASASASAFNLQWNVNGAKLEAGSTREVSYRGGEYRLTLFSKVVACRVSEGTETIAGGKPGTGKATLTLHECKTDQAGCKVRSAGGTFGTIEFTGLPTKLEERETSTNVRVLAENIESKKVGLTKEWGALEFEEPCSSYPAGKVKGSEAAELTNLEGAGINRNFPSPAVQGNTLEYFGTATAFTGSSDGTLVGGGSLTAS